MNTIEAKKNSIAEQLKELARLEAEAKRISQLRREVTLQFHNTFTEEEKQGMLERAKGFFSQAEKIMAEAKEKADCLKSQGKELMQLIKYKNSSCGKLKAKDTFSFDNGILVVTYAEHSFSFEKEVTATNKQDVHNELREVFKKSTIPFSVWHSTLYRIDKAIGYSKKDNIEKDIAEVEKTISEM